MNPRLVAQHTISSRADSAALALLRACSPVRLTAAGVLGGDALVTGAIGGCEPPKKRLTSAFDTTTQVSELILVSLRGFLTFIFV